MDAAPRFIWGAVLAIVGIIGLAVASRAESAGVYAIGLLCSLFCVALMFGLITEAFDRPDKGREAEGAALPLGPFLRNFSRIRAQGYEVMSSMNAIEKFVTGGLIGIFAVISLFVAARHGEGASYWGGLAVFAFLIGLIFYMISSVKHGADETH
ncbi:MAG TPA: hypothetical protein VMW18_08440 [Candidatus Binatia bacterium]|nr:hypothetical protein [Candidatus Binatia bacterium]